MIEPIDDYIEPQLIIQAKSKEIEKLTLKKDFVKAYETILELEDACYALENWLLRKIG